MSNLLRRGKRQLKKANDKYAKTHMKGFYQRLEALNEVALEMFKKEELDDITEDNIVEFAADYTDMTIESLEKKILLSKLDDYKNRVKQRDEAEN